MRVIKFRAWDSRNKKMIYEGLLLDQADAYELSWPTGKFKVPDFNPLQVEPLQFTGLKDKNGKEIWEGDIVRPFRDDFNCALIQWEYGSWQVEGGGILDNLKQYVEVIGNVYENPELLK